jgi:hypothetical protein
MAYFQLYPERLRWVGAETESRKQDWRMGILAAMLDGLRATMVRLWTKRGGSAGKVHGPDFFVPKWQDGHTPPKRRQSFEELLSMREALRGIYGAKRSVKNSKEKARYET